jgi:hypothetical protein
LVDVQTRQPAGVHINLSGLQRRSSSQNWRVSSGESALGWRSSKRA